MKICKDFLTIETIIGNLLPNTSDTAPSKGQHKNWRRENSDPMKPAARKLTFESYIKAPDGSHKFHFNLDRGLHENQLLQSTSIYQQYHYKLPNAQ